MKMSVVRIVAVLLFAIGVARAQLQSPFTVTPTLETKNGSTQIRVAFGVPPDHHLYTDKLAFEVDGTAVSPSLPTPVLVQDKFSGTEKKAYTKSFEVTYPLASGVSKVGLKIHLQGCDEANCYFPEDREFTLGPGGAVAVQQASAIGEVTPATGEWRDLAGKFTVAARGSGYLNEKDFLSFLTRAESGVKDDGGVRLGHGGWGLIATLCLILIGGLGLNLTPCVLPMIPINLAILGAGSQASSKRRGFALGGTYAAGMAIAYGVLGLVVVLTGAKFGTLNSSPWFNLAIAGVFIVLALAMFDIFAIDLSRFQGRVGGGSGESRSKFVMAYTMGSVAALLAGACVAPVVISVLLQATTLYNKGVVIGLALPFLLGLGMGLPWPFAGAGLSFLPKPGKWMARVKYGFGVLIVMFALYYGWLAFGLLRGSSSSTVASGQGTGSMEAATHEQLTAALAQAEKTGRPVLIDFWASWCKNCSAMEHTTFRSTAVQQQLGNYVTVKLQAERPNQQPTKEILDYFGAMGLPTYVILTPKDSHTPMAGKLASTPSS